MDDELPSAVLFRARSVSMGAEWRPGSPRDGDMADALARFMGAVMQGSWGIGSCVECHLRAVLQTTSAGWPDDDPDIALPCP